MSYLDLDNNDMTSFPDFEDEATVHIEKGPSEEPSSDLDSAPAEGSSFPESAPQDQSMFDLSAPAEPETVPDAEPAEESKVDAAPEPYGAPTFLMEDMIPVGFGKKKTEAELRAEEQERKKAEKEAEKQAKKQEKADKKREKTAALIAKVEAEAEQEAKREMEKESGEPYPLPSEKPSFDAEKPAVVKREYRPLEQHLRKKYKLEKDPLLSQNGAVPGFIIAKGETVIRSYSCLSTSKGDGILCLTNKRLLINAGECSEIAIDKITGIRFNRYARFTVFRCIVTLLLLGVGVFFNLFPTFSEGLGVSESLSVLISVLCWIIGPIFCLIGLFQLAKLFGKEFYFYVYAQEERPFFESKSRSYAKNEKKGKIYKYLVTGSGREIDKAARELGALIIEAKEGRYND